ncbi:hypothetical protein STCU_00832 [Strigomonas culicis]|nr:hypothetical protein STCU_00832 [Strigomonas culicis]|eukprot:EPY35946.1 hypothetical protein STCU_00832 [Strigomonas culicis]
MLVVPVFSMEEYLDQYFALTQVFESCWFPSPRSGSRFEEFCKQEFPVCATGEVQHHAMLATVAFQHHQLGILVNAGQRTSKFLTYPEMVELSKIKKMRFRDRRSDLMVQRDDGTTESLFDPHLMTTHDTQKLPFKRVLPHQLAAKLAARPPLPPIAQLELHLLLEPYEEIASVYIRTVERPKWRQILGASEKMTQIDVVCASASQKPSTDFLDHLKRWSFLREFKSDVHIELTHTIPVKQEGNEFMCVYTAADGNLLREMNTKKSGMTLAESLGFNDPLVDGQGRKPYEANSYF